MKNLDICKLGIFVMDQAALLRKKQFKIDNEVLESAITVQEFKREHSQQHLLFKTQQAIMHLLVFRYCGVI